MGELTTSRKNVQTGEKPVFSSFILHARYRWDGFCAIQRGCEVLNFRRNCNDFGLTGDFLSFLPPGADFRQDLKDIL